ncbi:MAG TPA: hypothetical protein VIJ00_10110 [Nakamurella sp.]
MFLSTVGRILHGTPDNGQDHPHIRHSWASTTAVYTQVGADAKNRMLRAALDVAFGAEGRQR